MMATDDVLSRAASIVANAKQRGESMTWFHAVAKLMDCECPEDVARELANGTGWTGVPNTGTRVTVEQVAAKIEERIAAADQDAERARGRRDGYAELLRRFVGEA